MEHRGLVAVLAVVALLNAAGADAGQGVKPPYCAYRCAGWRPCGKLCRLADETVTTCGSYGVCKPPEPIVFEAEPLPCPNNAARCERDGHSFCPAMPGFMARAASGSGLRLRFERRPEGVVEGSNIEWRFSVTEEAKGPVAYHVFAAPGRYSVTLRVTESVCNTQQSRTVTIDVPPLVDIPAVVPSPLPGASPTATLPD
jgi:hypothetical protein